jgi:hypothetical protein
MNGAAGWEKQKRERREYLHAPDPNLFGTMWLEE